MTDLRKGKRILTWKKMTIVLMPEDTNELRHFRVPQILVMLSIPLFLLSLISSIWLIQDDISLRSQAPRLAKMQQESQLQEGHFIKLAGRIKQLAQKVSALTEFDHKLKAMAGFEEIDGKMDHRGIGGSPMNINEVDFLLSENRTMQESVIQNLPPKNPAEEQTGPTLSSPPNLPPVHELQRPVARPVFAPMIRQKIKRPHELESFRKKEQPIKAYAGPVFVEPGLLREKTEERKKAYSVQVGAFLVQENAERLAVRLRQRGYNAYVKGLLDRLEKEWYTVRLRDFSDFEGALRLAESFKTQEGKLAIVTPIDSLTQIISIPTKLPTPTQSSGTGQ